MATTQLTAAALFQPAPSGVGPYGTVGGATLGAVPQVPGSGSWLATMLYVAQTVQLPTTAWQSGGPERTILATEAVCFALSDAAISQMAQGGFLQTAASGTVTYTAPDGTQITIPVTPDPSNAAQNPTGAPGYLDLLADNVYDVQRLQASNVSGPLAIAKLSAGALTYSAGAYHVGNALSGASYHNEADTSIAASTSAGGGVTAVDIAGPTTVILTTSAAHGLTQGQSVYVLIPTSTGVSGLAGVFALVQSVPTATTLYLALGGVAGTYSGTGGAVYTCTVVTMVADATGTTSNASPGAVNEAITQNANVYVSNITAWAGSNYESNLALAQRCQISLAARSPNGPSQAYDYFALSAYQLLLAQTPSVQLSNGPISQAYAFSTPATGIVSTVVASATPASTTFGQPVTPGAAQLPVSSVTQANPAVITCTSPLQISGGSFPVTISGVLGPAVNGTFLASYVSPTSFSIPVDATSGSAYAGGGTVEAGDLGQVDKLIRQSCVPDNTTAITVSALALPIQITATVTVPAAYVTAYQLAALTQLQTQIASYGIGGAAAGVTKVSWDDILVALGEAGIPSPDQASYAHVQSLSLNGQPSGADVAFSSNLYQAILVSPAITVVGT